MDLTLCQRCEGHFRDSDYLVVKKRLAEYKREFIL